MARNPAQIAADLAEWRKGVSSQPFKAVLMEAIVALRSQPTVTDDQRCRYDGTRLEVMCRNCGAAALTGEPA
jgi:hypothetical protein